MHKATSQQAYFPNFPPAFFLVYLQWPEVLVQKEMVKGSGLDSGFVSRKQAAPHAKVLGTDRGPGFLHQAITDSQRGPGPVSSAQGSSVPF